MSGRLDGKVAIVTGAGSSGSGWGNGKATAVLFAREGAKVLGIDISRQAVEETADIARAEGVDFTPHVADLTDPEAVKAAVDVCIARHGRVDALVNNVGVYELGSIDKDLDYFERVQRINMGTMFLVTREVVPHMVRQGTGGSVVNLSSVAATHSTGNAHAIYCETKAAVVGFTRSLAIEYAARRIRFNSIMPGVIDTPLVLEPIRRKVSPEEFQRILADRQHLAPIGRTGTGWDVAKAALFLASDEAEYVTATEIVVDGGITAQFG